mmetsp:Transcript_6552/g.18810  ORF Transcript_6552/g.18810 Transcript_6552/m.18810 type:complete len:100 (-) Transcript_6552:123-422(-)
MNNAIAKLITNQELRTAHAHAHSAGHLPNIPYSLFVHNRGIDFDTTVPPLLTEDFEFLGGDSSDFDYHPSSSSSSLSALTIVTRALRILKETPKRKETH